MNDILAFLQAHLFWVGIISFWVFSAAVSSLPAPTQVATNPFYAWFYAFVTQLAGNFRNAFGTKIPGYNAPLDHPTTIGAPKP